MISKNYYLVSIDYDSVAVAQNNPFGGNSHANRGTDADQAPTVTLPNLA